MSTTTLRLIVAGVLVVHGLGHILGIMAALQMSTLEGWSSHSWLLTGLIGDGASRAISFVLFLVAMLGSVGTALALMGWLVPHELWRPLAVISAVVSLVALTLFWQAFPSFFPNKLGAIVVDTAILVGILWVEWPTEAAVGY